MKSYHHHLIKNFNKETSLLKKIIGNIIFLIGVTKVTRRENGLTPHDYKQALIGIQKGDVLLVGNHRRVSALFIGGPVTHTLIYIGGGRVVHAVSDGVMKEKFKDVFSEFDTLVIARPRIQKNKKALIKKTVQYIKQQIGKPFDFFFDESKQEFFCSELVNNAFLDAGFDTGLRSHKQPKGILDEKIKLLKVTRALHPKEFIHGNFDTVFISDSLKNIKL